MAYNDYGPADFIDDALNPFEEVNNDRTKDMESADKQHSVRKEITVKFGKGLVDDTFTAKSGEEMARILIPNQEPTDKSPWESFVVPANMVHDNQFGKGVWMKLPEDGKTTLSRSVVMGEDDKTGEKLWVKQERVISNTELKSMMESYKDKDRGSVLSDLGDKKEKVTDAAKDAPKKESKSKSKDAR